MSNTIHLHRVLHATPARVGGSYEMSFKNFSAAFGGKFLELVPNERPEIPG